MYSVHFMNLTTFFPASIADITRDERYSILKVKSRERVYLVTRTDGVPILVGYADVCKNRAGK